MRKAEKKEEIKAIRGEQADTEENTSNAHKHRWLSKSRGVISQAEDGSSYVSPTGEVKDCTSRSD